MTFALKLVTVIGGTPMMEKLLIAAHASSWADEPELRTQTCSEYVPPSFIPGVHTKVFAVL